MINKNILPPDPVPVSGDDLAAAVQAVVGEQLAQSGPIGDVEIHISFSPDGTGATVSPGDGPASPFSPDPF